MNDTNKKKLTLTLLEAESFEVRAAPNTVCPDSGRTTCCRTSRALAEKLTAVAFF